MLFFKQTVLLELFREKYEAIWTNWNKLCWLERIFWNVSMQFDVFLFFCTGIIIHIFRSIDISFYLNILFIFSNYSYTVLLILLLITLKLFCRIQGWFFLFEVLFSSFMSPSAGSSVFFLYVSKCLFSTSWLNTLFEVSLLYT